MDECKEKNILFRANGNSKIGLGHIVRCLALAGELKRRHPGLKITFVTDGKDVVEMLKSSGYAVKNSGKNGLARIKFLAKGGAILITDILYTSKKYILELKKIKDLKIVSIDNNTKFKSLNADILINANVFSDNCRRAIGSTRVFLGPKYMILRKEFGRSNIKRTINNKVKNILVISGGADRKKLILKVAKALEGISKDIKINLILGPAYSHLEEFKDFLLSTKRNFNLMVNPKNLFKVMEKSDLAVTAAGVTLYELAALGVPCIVIPQAKHQEHIAQEFVKAGACVNLGKSADRKTILREVSTLIDDKKLRRGLSRKSRAFVDGKGLDMVAELIISETF